MKRKDLEALGLEKEAIDKIMYLNGEDINNEKAKATDLEEKLKASQLEVANLNKSNKDLEGNSTKIESLNKEIEELKVSNASLLVEKTNLTSEVESVKTGLEKKHNIDMYLIERKAKNIKAVKALIPEKDLEDVVFEDGKSEELTKIVDNLMEKESYLFGGDSNEGSGYNPKGGKSTPNQVSMAEAITQSIQAQTNK